MSTIRVMRKVLNCDAPPTIHAGYGEISVSTAVGFLDHWAKIEADESRLAIQSGNQSDWDEYKRDDAPGEKLYWERTLLQDDVPQVLYYLAFPDPTKDFHATAQVHIEALQSLIDDMPHRGDTEEDSQKVCLQNALNRLERCVTGTGPEDFDELD